MITFWLLTMCKFGVALSQFDLPNHMVDTEYAAFDADTKTDTSSMSFDASNETAPSENTHDEETTDSTHPPDHESAEEKDFVIHIQLKWKGVSGQFDINSKSRWIQRIWDEYQFPTTIHVHENRFQFHIPNWMKESARDITSLVYLEWSQYIRWFSHFL